MKKLSALILAIILIISAFAGVIPTSAAKADKLAPLSAKSDTAPLGDYFEPCYNEPMDIFNILFGDADMDGALTIKDATIIQKAIAVLVYLSDESLMLADVTGDNYVSINDATAIQKHVAGLEKTFPVYAEFAFPEGSNTTTYSCTGSGYAEIRFTITEPDMYFISHGSSSKKMCRHFSVMKTAAISPQDTTAMYLTGFISVETPYSSDTLKKEHTESYFTPQLMAVIPIRSSEYAPPRIFWKSTKPPHCL